MISYRHPKHSFIAIANLAKSIISEAATDTVSTTSNNLSFLTDTSTIRNSIFSIFRRSYSITKYVYVIYATLLKAIGANIAIGVEI